MATATVKNRCIMCNKEKASVKCEGCLRTFCYNHIGDHRQVLSQQLDEIETNRAILQQILTEQTAEPRKHSLMQEIDKWERDSINKIRQTADKARQLLLKQTTEYVATIEAKLANLTHQLRANRKEIDFVETDLDHWKDELTRLTNELNEQPNLIIRQYNTPLITKILVDVPALLCIPNIDASAKWIQDGITVAGGNESGDGLNQLSNPCGIYIDDDQTIYVVDQCNHRIIEWKSGATSGQVVAGGNGQGNQSNQLNYPSVVIVDKVSDSLIISDYRNRRVMRWPRQNGISGETIVYDVCAFGLAMDSYGYLYVSDYGEHEVKRWKVGKKNGIVVAGGNGSGNRLDQLNYPMQIVVDQDHSVYVSENKSHRVTKWW